MLFNLLEQGTTALLYESGGNTATSNWIGFLAPIGLFNGEHVPSRITLESSWTDYSGSPMEQQSGGCYVILPAEPASGTADVLMNQVANKNQQYRLSYRYVLWASISSNNTSLAGFIAFATPTGSGIVQQQGVLNFRNLGLVVPQLLPIGLDTQANQLTLHRAGSLALQLMSTVDTPRAVGSGIASATLPLTGPLSGVAQFNIMLTSRSGQLESDFDTLNLGVKYFYTDGATTRGQLFPILNASSGGDSFPFSVILDPLNPLTESRTRFTFADPGTSQPVFITGLATEAGIALTLTPIAANAGFMLAADRTTSVNPNPHQIDTYHACLSGSFRIGGVSGGVNLLCGLSGVESVSLNLGLGAYEGDLLTFQTGQAARATVFPVPATQLSGAGLVSTAPLLDTKFLTSWASITSGKGIPSGLNQYFTQSAGAELFGNGPVIAQAPELVGHFQTPVANITPATGAFPMAGYAAFTEASGPDDFAAGVLPAFETQVLSPTRHRILRGALTDKVALSPRRMGFGAQGTAGTAVQTATPQGLLGTVDTGGNWSSLLLAQNRDSTGTMQNLEFLNIAPLLQDAFETNQQFLVISKWPTSDSWPTTFSKKIEIEGWPFDVDLDNSGSFGSYHNLLIFKFCSGTLAQRVANPLLWTHASDFNDVADDGLTAVSSYLQAYLSDAAKQAVGSAYDNFNRVVNDENWQGILALQVNLNPTELPPQIQSLMAGIQLNLFRAHHLGIEVNPVQQDGSTGLKINGNSSLFGLIDYKDPAYAAAQSCGVSPNWPVPAAPGDFDFKVLMLRVLFENTEIRTFQSKAQVTVNTWFSDPVKKLRVGTGSLVSNSLVLDGVLQTHNGFDTYVFRSNLDTVFELDSNVLQAVEVVETAFNTMQSASSGSTLETSRFSFSGYLNLGAIPGFDGFSFGGQDLGDNEVGLHYSNLYLEMQFDLNTPSKRSFTFDPSQITFDVSRSVARSGSLFKSFPLQVTGFLQGDGNSQPVQQGYLPVQIQNSGFGSLSTSASWYGLQMSLNLGTPGALASSVEWSASLLLCWSAGSIARSSNYLSWMGIKLPGASGNGKLLSLQGVLKLAIGSIEFLYIAKSKSYLLKLTQIALKFFGISFPQNGSTIFYLFGDPKGGGSSTLGWYAAYNLARDGKPDLKPKMFKASDQSTLSHSVSLRNPNSSTTHRK